MSAQKFCASSFVEGENRHRVPDRRCQGKPLRAIRVPSPWARCFRLSTLDSRLCRRGTEAVITGAPRKRLACQKRARGFESHPLRHITYFTSMAYSRFQKRVCVLCVSWHRGLRSSPSLLLKGDAVAGVGRWHGQPQVNATIRPSANGASGSIHVFVTGLSPFAEVLGSCPTAVLPMYVAHRLQAVPGVP